MCSTYNFFISYRRTAGAEVSKIVQILRSYGHRVFFDKDSIHEGRWDTQIEAAIKNSQKFIFINSVGAFYRPDLAENNDVFFREIATAVSMNRENFITPIRITTNGQQPDNLSDSTLPRMLRVDAIKKLQKIDFKFDGDQAKFENALINHFNDGIKWKKLFSATDSKPPEPVDFTVGKAQCKMMPVSHAGGCYYIAEMPVSCNLWNAVYNLPGEGFDGQKPKTEVSYEDCTQFIAKLNGIKPLPDFSFSLPSKGEWQYAASGGSKSKVYEFSGSDNVDEVAWYRGNSKSNLNNCGYPKKANELGICNMSGGVWEWCSDKCKIGERTDGHYCLGGSYLDTKENVSSNSEAKFPDDYKAQICGFRLACKIDH